MLRNRMRKQNPAESVAGSLTGWVTMMSIVLESI